MSRKRSATTETCSDRFNGCWDSVDTQRRWALILEQWGWIFFSPKHFHNFQKLSAAIARPRLCSIGVDVTRHMYVEVSSLLGFKEILFAFYVSIWFSILIDSMCHYSWCYSVLNYFLYHVGKLHICWDVWSRIPSIGRFMNLVLILNARCRRKNKIDFYRISCRFSSNR